MPEVRRRPGALLQLRLSPELMTRWRIAKGKMRDEHGKEITGPEFLAMLLHTWDDSLGR